MTLAKCSCKPDRPYADGTMPEYFQTHGEALEAVRRSHRQKPYWGVHVKDLHAVVGVSEPTP